MAAPLLITAVALFIVAADNDTFWQSAWRATLNDEHRLAILSSLLILVFCTLTTVLSLALGMKLLRACAAPLLLVAASNGYFMVQYGIVIDESMIRNTVETTVLEATPLLNAAYFWHVALFGASARSGRPAGAYARRLRWQTDRRRAWYHSSDQYRDCSPRRYTSTTPQCRSSVERMTTCALQINPVYPLYAAARFGLRSDDGAPVVRQHSRRSRPRRHIDAA